MEDSQDDIDLTLRALEKYDMTTNVVIARDGLEALEVLSATAYGAERGNVAMLRLILLDINMPRMSGLEVLRRLREVESTRYVPVVMLTTSNDRRDVLDSYAMGANSYIQKPVSFAEFTATVGNLVDYWLALNQMCP